MSSWQSYNRKFEANQKREEREARRRQKEIERQILQESKRTALEQAQLEVEKYENLLEVLTSIHKDQSEPINWRSLAASLAPHPPINTARHELEFALRGSFPVYNGNANRNEEEALSADKAENAAAFLSYRKAHLKWEASHSFVLGVLRGEPGYYIQAITEYLSRSELSILGSSIDLTVDSPALVECKLKVNEKNIIPTEVKSLTEAGKLLVKPMPKWRFQEIYQIYICCCVLRLARELFSGLPIKTAILSVLIDGTDPATGHPAEKPILSFVATKAVIDSLNYDLIQPLAAVSNLQCRGVVNLSKKSAEFVKVIPIAPNEIELANRQFTEIHEWIDKLREMRQDVNAFIQPMVSASHIKL